MVVWLLNKLIEKYRWVAEKTEFSIKSALLNMSFVRMIDLRSAPLARYRYNLKLQGVGSALAASETLTS